MGRPIKKKFFGNAIAAGFQIKGVAWLNGSATPAYIVRQQGTRKYLFTDGTNSAVCMLVNGTPTAVGQAQIIVTPFGGSAENARTILEHTVKTFAGNEYTWKADGSNSSGYAKVGTDSSLVAVGATVSVTVTAGAVSGYTSLVGGSAYLSVPTVTLSAPNGVNGALGAVTLSGGAIVLNGIAINNPGSGYAGSSAAITISGNGTGAAANAVITNGVITSINITNYGSGYTTATASVAPVVKLQATAHATLSGGSVASVVTDVVGAGYVSATATISTP